MKQITLGTTGITVPQNAFGALPIQRVSADEAVRLLRRAREGGMRFFDTARAYTDSEEKLGLAFGGQWDGLYVATKTAAKTPEALRADLETSLRLLQRDYIDIYQFHMAGQCYRPGDGTCLSWKGDRRGIARGHSRRVLRRKGHRQGEVGAVHQ